MKAQQLGIFDRSVLIIGPGRHFGEETAIRFSQEGYRIGLISRSANSLRLAGLSLANAGVTCFCHPADVTDRQQLFDAIQTLSESLPNLSCVIYNVKDSVRGSGYVLRPETLLASLNVNFVGAINTIQLCVPLLKECATRKSDSDITPSIILTGGGYKDKPDPNKLTLSVAKAGIHTIYDSLNRDRHNNGIFIKTLVIDGYVAREGLRAIHPGLVAEKLWQAFISKKPKLYDTISFSSMKQQLLISGLELFDWGAHH